MVAIATALVDVYCRNQFCREVMKNGRRALVGRISGKAELRCPSCRQVALYEAG